MKIWFDTEFYENGRTIDLISIGMVREDGAEYYAENFYKDYYSNATPWLAKNVYPHLSKEPGKYPATIAKEILEFAGAKPEFWAYYADYDWVVLCQLYHAYPVETHSRKNLLDVEVMYETRLG